MGSVRTRSHRPNFLLVVFGILSLVMVSHLWASNSLKMGVFPRYNRATTFQLYKPLAVYLTQQLGRDVELVTSKDYTQFWEQVSNGQIDLVHYNQYHYVRSHKESGYEVILLNEEMGQHTIRSAIFVHRDSGIDSVTDLRHKTILFGGGQQAMVSFISAKHLLSTNGLAENEYRTRIARNPPNALMATVTRSVDASGGGSILLKLPVVQAKVNTSKLKIIATSDPLPQLPWAVSSSLKPALRQGIIDALLALDDHGRGQGILTRIGLTGFVAAKDERFDSVRQIVQQLLNEKY